MGEYGLRVVADDNDEEWQSWSAVDVTHWMVLTPPNSDASPDNVKKAEPINDTKEFTKAVTDVRRSFSQFIQNNYGVDGHLKLRTHIDTLLIMLDQCVDRLQSKQPEQVSGDVEEAAKNYAQKTYVDAFDKPDKSNVAIFVAGAKWQSQQPLKLTDIIFSPEYQSLQRELAELKQKAPAK